MKAPRIEIYQNAAGEWAWRLVARNGEIVGQGESYRSRGGAVRGMAAFRRAAAEAVVVLR